MSKAREGPLTCAECDSNPPHLQALARAHIESVMLDCMLAGVAGCVDPDCRQALKAMAHLFALDRIQADMLFRNDDYVAPEKVSERGGRGGEGAAAGVQRNLLACGSRVGRLVVLGDNCVWGVCMGLLHRRCDAFPAAPCT